MLKTPSVIVKTTSSLCLLFLLTGCVEGYCFLFCYDSVPVQKAYVGQRDLCQLLAERKIPLYMDMENPPPPKERNTILLALFSECMHGKDWGVTAPKRETDGPRRNRQVVEREPPVREDDVVISSSEEDANRVVLPDHLYRDPDRARPEGIRPRSGPLVGQGIGPGYDPGYDEQDHGDAPSEYYNYRR